MLPGEGAPDTLHEVIDAPTYGRFRNYICTCTETDFIHPYSIFGIFLSENFLIITSLVIISEFFFQFF